MLIKRYKAGNVVFLQDQILALVGVLFFLFFVFFSGPICLYFPNCLGRMLLTEIKPVGFGASLQPEAPSLGRHQEVLSLNTRLMVGQHWGQSSEAG